MPCSGAAGLGGAEALLGAAPLPATLPEASAEMTAAEAVDEPWWKPLLCHWNRGAVDEPSSSMGSVSKLRPTTPAWRPVASCSALGPGMLLGALAAAAV